MTETMIAFERPRPDPELRPLLVRLPDAVGFQALRGRERVLVRVTRDAIEQRLQLDRPGLWRDFDAVWPEIADAAEARICHANFDAQRDPATGLRVVSLDRFDLRGPPHRATPRPAAAPATLRRR